jgi:DNA repair exonuclease SbcCD nuclease subunit
MPRPVNVSDLHITGRPVDEYRWQIFPWLRKTIERRNATHLNILGDLTEMKDGHPSKLVNRLVDEIEQCTKLVPVVILRGNHDYIDPRTPFFRFLSKIKHLTYINEIEAIKYSSHFRALYLPHTRAYRGDWSRIRWGKYNRIYIHQTITGSVSSSGARLDDVPVGALPVNDDAWVVAGDVHTPQTIGERFVYCGAPHPINFGDDFKPRVLFDDGEKLHSIEHTTIKKVQAVISAPDDLKAYDLTEGDMLKVVLKLDRRDYVSFRQYKCDVTDYAKQNKLLLCGVELQGNADEQQTTPDERNTVLQRNPRKTVKRFARVKELDGETRAAGLQLLQEVE